MSARFNPPVITVQGSLVKSLCTFLIIYYILIEAFAKKSINWAANIIEITT